MLKYLLGRGVLPRRWEGSTHAMPALPSGQNLESHDSPTTYDEIQMILITEQSSEPFIGSKEVNR